MSLPKQSERTLMLSPDVGFTDVMDLVGEHFPRAASCAVDLSPELFQRLFPDAGGDQVAVSFYADRGGDLAFSVPVMFECVEYEPFATIFCGAALLTLQPLTVNVTDTKPRRRRTASKPSKGSGSRRRSRPARSPKPRGAKKPAR